MTKALFLRESKCKHIVGKIFSAMCFCFWTLGLGALPEHVQNSVPSTRRALTIKVNSVCMTQNFEDASFSHLINSDSSILPTVTISMKGTLLTADKLQQCYVVTNDNSLLKYNKNGQLLFRYNNNRLGTLNWVDATDPFNILLFYPDYFTVILLDRTLSITGEYQLYDLNITDVHVVAMDNDNNLWLFDDNTGKLIKISRAGEVLEESVNTKLLLEKNIKPNAMFSVNNMVYLNDPDVGILVFDSFGTYLKQIPLIGLDAFQIIDRQLLYQREGQLYAYHLESLLTSAIELPFKLEQNDQLSIQKGVLFLLKETGLMIYERN
jgi:hypothetical protein